MGENNAKKIIIISEYYAPQNAIGAVRMSKITKYLNTNSEYSILVVSRECETVIKDEILEKDVQNKASIVRVPGSKIVKMIQTYLENRNSSITSISINHAMKVKKSSLSVLRKTRSKVSETLNFFLVFIIDAFFFKRNVIKHIKKIDISDYSAMISTCGPLSCHLIARRIKQLNPGIKWIADFRDPVSNFFVPFGFKSYARNYARRVTKYADVIVAVSHGYMESLFLDENKEKHIITNGYDMEDLEGINFRGRKTGKLTISYTGDLYAGRRDFSILFKAISELIYESRIVNDNIEIQYAGRSGCQLLEQARKYGMESIVVNNGYVSHKKALELQIDSDILLMAAWNTNGGLGNIPGKLFDYMMMGKPIICITTGELAGSEVKEIIQSGDLGFCYEDGNKEIDFIQLKKYILEFYKYKVVEKRSIPFNPIKQVIESYSYGNKAKEFERLLQA